MKTNRKTIKMPVRYLMNAVLVALLFVGLSFLTQNVLSTYQNKVLLTVGINIILAVSPVRRRAGMPMSTPNSPAMIHASTRPITKATPLGRLEYFVNSAQV